MTRVVRSAPKAIGVEPACVGHSCFFTSDRPPNRKAHTASPTASTARTMSGRRMRLNHVRCFLLVCRESVCIDYPQEEK
jgi:hypothetical protein